jgi:signal transduction histidine kinase
MKASCKVDNTAKKIIVDPDLLKRVINNLVLNAIQAMPQGGKLSIHVYRKEDNIIIEVQDTGTGIPQEIKSKLFTPMFTTKSKGQGFGLSVVKRVTESMNGTVAFESEPGKGTKFIVCLPQSQPKS